VHALAPTTHVAPLVKTIVAFHHLHPLVDIDLPPFGDDFHLEMNLVLDTEAFIFALMCSPCFSSNGPLNMVYELLQDCLKWTITCLAF
jgi:hypothetical protein